MQLEMPAVDTSAVDVNTAAYVKEAYAAVKGEDPVGILSERDMGTVPVYIDPANSPYAGVTEFKPHYNGPRAHRVGINRGVPNRRVRRVAEHEFRHVRAEELLKYMDDVPDHQARLIMESYAEFAGIANGKKKEIVHTTPYIGEIKFAYAVDSFYKSELDGSTGYRAFIKDVQRYGSAKKALTRLGRSIKESGVSMREVLQTAERKMAA